jgi:dienelactone hydrolase
MNSHSVFKSHLWTLIAVVIVIWGAGSCRAAKPTKLPGTRSLTGDGDFSAQMVAGIDKYLTGATARSVKARERLWKRDHSSSAGYAKSVEPNRQRLRAIIGAVDQRQSPVVLEYISGPKSPAIVAETESYRVFAVRWTVFEGVHGAGLLVEPRESSVAQVIAIPDADQTPEMLLGLQPGVGAQAQIARRLAEAGCRVIIPMLIDRRSTWSGNPEIAMTDQTHREWVYRQAFEMGRHVIGYEVQTVLAAVDWMSALPGNRQTIGVAGYGEGGLIALYAAALDTRIDAALVSGYFNSRQQLWSEPIYRNVFGLLREFGDAEIASLLAPRTLIVEHSRGPLVDGPPRLLPGRRRSAAPGSLVPLPYESVRKELDRARLLCSSVEKRIGRFHLVSGAEGDATKPGSEKSLTLLLTSLSHSNKRLKPGGVAASDQRKDFNSDKRQRQQVDELMRHSQRRLRRSERIRAEFWKDAGPATSLDEWTASIKPYKKYLWEEVLGRLPDPSLPINPRSRLIKEAATWTMYEVQLDVWPDVFTWGYLLVPKGIKPGEKRPVVVCQHGLEGLPDSVVNEDPDDRGFRSYRAYAVRLAERGFVTYAPHNPYRGETAFRQLQRKANPLGLTLYSFILGQHQRTLQWLGRLPFIDSQRIAFYGLSYGGTSAMRIPSLLDGYSLSICSACFNDSTRKIMSLDFRSSYMFTREYEQFTFNLGSTFNHAEMGSLIAPRPFMVERGHRDGVAPDEWVAYEYAKVRRHYANLGIAERTAIEFFDGPHVIHGKGTFDFLHRHLNWPKP